jgi:hypothetical protein
MTAHIFTHITVRYACFKNCGILYRGGHLLFLLAIYKGKVYFPGVVSILDFNSTFNTTNVQNAQKSMFLYIYRPQ